MTHEHSRPHRFTTRACGLLIAVLAVTRNAGAQAPVATSVPDGVDHGRLVQSASRYAQDVGDAPASITIISADEIRTYGYRTLADILGAARGFFTRYDRNYAYVTVRGLSRQSDYNTRILVLVDGHRINDAVTDASGIGTDALIDLDIVDHVEIVHGPGSALYGTSAFFGVVNLVTKHARALPGLQLTTERGSFATTRGALSFGHRFMPAHEFVFSASMERRGGQDLPYAEFADSTPGSGVAHALDGERTARAFAVVTAGDLTMRWAYALRHRSIPTGSYETNFDDPRSGTWERTMSASIGYEHAFQDLSRAYVNASIDEYAYGGTFPYASVVFRDGNDGHALSLETQYLRVLASGHTVTVGSRIRYVGRARMDAYDVSPPNTYVDLRKTARSGAVFAQAAWLLGSHATLYTGIRHDRYEDFGGGTNPRLALVLHPTLNTSVKALYGQAFRTPSLYERFYDDGSVTQKRAAHLRPEHVRTLELSLEHRLSAELALSLDAYDVRTHDLINLTSDPADQLLVYINEGRPRSTGFEGEFSARIGRVEGRAALAREYARDEKSTTLFDSPRTTGRVGVSVPVTPRGRLAFEMRHLSERATLAGSKLPAYTLLNLTFTARLLSPAIELLLAAQNALDLPYADPAGEEHRQTSIVQDGRSIRASVRLLLK